jgi:hypothetical protein
MTGSQCDDAAFTISNATMMSSAATLKFGGESVVVVDTSWMAGHIRERWNWWSVTGRGSGGGGGDLRVVHDGGDWHVQDSRA